MRLKSIINGQVYSRKFISLIIAGISIALFVIGYLYYKNEKHRIKRERFQALKTINDFKIDQILVWQKERMADAIHFSASPLYVTAIGKWLNTKDTAIGNEIMRRDQMIRDLRGFESVNIVGVGRINRIESDTVHRYEDTLLNRYIDSALISRKIIVTSFYRNLSNNHIHQVIISPIVDNNRAIACILFYINPRTYFYPMVQNTPASGKSSEIVLVQKFKDSVLYINELKYDTTAACKLMLPLSDTGYIVVKAIMGQTGAVEGKDYRGVDVLADIEQLTGTNWYIISKIDSAEAFSELTYRKVAILIIVIILILLFISAFAIIIIVQDREHDREIIREIEGSEAKMKQAEFMAKTGNWEFHFNSGKIFASTGAMKIYGLPTQKLEITEVQKIPLPEYRSLLDKAMKNLIEKGEPYDVEFKIKRLTDNEIIDIHSVAMYDPDHNIVFGTIHDITEYKSVQNALKESQQQMRDIIEFLPDAIFAIDIERKVIAWNRAIQDMTGVLAADILGEGNFEYSLPFFGKRIPILIDFLFHDYPEQAKNYDTIQKHGDTLIAESSIVEINGKRLILYGKARPLYDAEGNVTGAIELIRDITEIKTKEEQLKEKELVFQSLLDHSPIYVFFKDHNIRSIYLSQNFEKMLGVPVSEILGKTMDELFPSDMAKSMIEDDKMILEQGKLIEVEEELNGRYYSTIKFPIHREGAPNMLAGFTIDITDRKKAEQELILARDKAEKSDKLKDAFLQNMSHEIRTPLNAIVGFAELLLEPEIDKERIDQYTTIIHSSGYQLLSIVDDILTVARIQTGQEVANEKPVNIQQVLSEIDMIFSPKMAEKDLTFNVKGPVIDADTEILTDRTKLTQILSNLLTNAIKFTHEGSITVECNHKDNMLEFSVRDTGIGIATDMQEIIFERFVQADHSITRKYGGTGLGLSICKAYTKILGGDIWVKSIEGEGSAFHFTIPFRPVQNQETIKVPNKPIKIDDKQETVLVAEDEEFNFQLIKEYLYDFNYNILRAANGVDAIEICRQNKDIDLVLMDIKMPGIDGATAMIEIKQIRPELTIIAQTAYALINERNEFLKSGFDDYISKPITKEALIKVISKYL